MKPHENLPDRLQHGGTAVPVPGWQVEGLDLVSFDDYRFQAQADFTCRDEEEHDAMQATEIQDYARRLFEAHGTKAIAEAAQKACVHEQKGDKEQAQTWRRIEAALLLMRGPNEK
jgi:hypothetical protein